MKRITQAPEMTVENAHAFLDEMKKNGPSPELLAQVGTNFDKSHMNEALKKRGIDLSSASGGNTNDWVNTGVSAASAGA